MAKKRQSKKPRGSASATKKFELTQTMRDYLQSAFRITNQSKPITVTALSKAQAVAPASATAMVKKLTGLRLMTHLHYGAITLTEEGRRQALLAVRRHRLLECFLQKILRLDLDEVHDESHRLEPVISDLLEARIDETLGHPTHCPHGDPIPDANGVLRREKGFPITELKEGQRAQVLTVPGSNKNLLRYLLDLGIEPERRLTLVKREPFGGPLHLKIGRKSVFIGPEAAQTVYVNVAK